MPSEADDLVLGLGIGARRLKDFDASGKADITFIEIRPFIQLQGGHEGPPAAPLDRLQGVQDHFSARKPGMTFTVLGQGSIDATELRNKEVKEEAVDEQHER